MEKVKMVAKTKSTSKRMKAKSGTIRTKAVLPANDAREPTKTNDAAPPGKSFVAKALFALAGIAGCVYVRQMIMDSMDRRVCKVAGHVRTKDGLHPYLGANVVVVDKDGRLAVDIETNDAGASLSNWHAPTFTITRSSSHCAEAPASSNRLIRSTPSKRKARSSRSL
jgi:hypothetical protein